MELKKLSADQFKDMIYLGAENLKTHMDLINSLNVFPVPDGDTGTNMHMTFQSGAERVAQTDSDHVGQLAQAMSQGLLMGARGNSGVILSQIFRGFSQAIQGVKDLDSQTFVAAFTGGVDSAYKAVMKPVEGTILTVCREAARMGEKAAEETDNIIDIMQAIVQGAQLSLEKTPELLPVLKQVGVVDSGGKGLLTIYEGFLGSLKGEKTAMSKDGDPADQYVHHHDLFDGHMENPMTMEEITFGFCTEIMVRIGEGATGDRPFDLDHFRKQLNELGDSLLAIADDEIIKVHIHTEDPGRIMQMGQEYGELIKIKVDNMREQVRELEQAKGYKSDPDSPVASLGQEGPKDFAIITVAAGKGMIDLLKSFGVDHVLAGGQTMNPSTQDFVQAMEALSADRYILLPNNKNIVMAAEQAADLVDQAAIVIPSKSIPQGITSLMAFNPDMDLEANKANMIDALGDVVTAQITHAIRDTEIDSMFIKEGDFMGIIQGDIKLAHSDIQTSLDQTFQSICGDETELLTLFVGEDGDFQLAESMAEQWMEAYPDLDIEIIQGDQPVYPYILAVE